MGYRYVFRQLDGYGHTDIWDGNGHPDMKRRRRRPRRLVPVAARPAPQGDRAREGRACGAGGDAGEDQEATRRSSPRRRASAGRPAQGVDAAFDSTDADIRVAAAASTEKTLYTKEMLLELGKLIKDKSDDCGWPRSRAWAPRRTTATPRRRRR